MEFEVSREDAATVLTPVGRLDGLTAEYLEARISEVVGPGEAVLVLDCSRLRHISSGGLRALLIGAKLCRQRDGDLAVAALQPQCRRVLEVTGFLSILDHYETLAAALAADGRERRAEKRGRGEAPERAALMIEERRSGPAVVLYPIGQLNEEGARVLESRVSGLVADGDALIVLDCTGMTYVNSAGLRALLVGAKLCGRQEGTLSIAALQPQCRSVVSMSGFLSVIDCFESGKAALTALAGETGGPPPEPGPDETSAPEHSPPARSRAGRRPR